MGVKLTYLLLLLTIQLSFADSLSIREAMSPTDVWPYAERLTTAPEADLKEVMAQRDWLHNSVTKTSVGFSSDAQWLRFGLTNSMSTAMDVRFFWHQAKIDYVDIYLVSASGELIEQQSLGALMPYEQRPIPSRMFEWQSRLAANSDYHVYIRAYSPLSISFGISVGSLAQMEQQARLNEAWAYLYLGIMFTLVVYNIALGLQTRELSLLYYGIYIVLISAYVLNIYGFGFFLGAYDDSIGQVRASLTLATTWMVAALLFTKHFLAVHRYSPHLLWLHRLLLAASILACGIGMWPAIGLFFRIVPALNLIIIAYIIACAIVALRQGKAYARYFLIGWLCMLAGTLIHQIGVFFTLQSDWLARESVKFGTALEALFLALALGMRIRELRAQNRTLQEEKNQALESANQELALRLASQQELAQQKDDLLNLMSHELKTPLNVIQTSIDLYRNNPGDLLPTKDLFDSSERMRRHVNNLVMLAEISSGHAFSTTQSTRIGDITSQLNEYAIAHLRPGQRWHLDVDIDAETHIALDEHKVHLLLENLIDNAIKFTEEGHIYFRLSQQAGQLCWSIEDTGVGIDDDVIKRIDEQFCQSDASKTRRYEGLGLGMAVVTQLTHLLHGSLEIAQVDSGGTSICLCLPMQKSAQPTHCLHASLTALVVDDNEVNLKLMAKICHKLGFAVTAVSSGEAAIAALAQEDFQAIFMDVQMPGMDGFSATRAIRKLGFKGKIFAVSANDTSTDRQRAADVGMDDFIAKPIRLMTLKNKLAYHHFLIESEYS